MFRRPSLESSRRHQIIKLASPVILGMLSTNILDIVDTAMVSQFGNKALAATGFASFLFFVSFSATIGISSAVQSITSRRLGENKLDQCGLSLNAGILIISVYFFVTGSVLMVFAPSILGFFSNDPQVNRLSVDYYLWRLPGVLALGIGFCFRGFWNGIKSPNTYTIILVLTHVLNVLLNWLLIFGNLGFPSMGVKGAAIGSTLALFIGMFSYIIVTKKMKSAMNALTYFPNWSQVKKVIYIGGPAALDQFLLSLFLLLMFWIFGQIGTSAAAVAHVVIMCTMILFLPSIGLGITSLSLVSESLGKGNKKDAKQWAWDTIKAGLPYIALVGFILFCFPKPVLSIFIHDQSTLKLAIFPFRIDLLMMCSVCINIICVQSLIGAGATRFVMIFKVIFRYLILLPIVYVAVAIIGKGIGVVWILWALTDLIETIILIIIWQRERWASINI
ncbi:MAG: MATE family efflux transporter [Candidatus Margulisiibacteriota bacterium]|nr:MATE family efflux transporter [Candidatus Margulisiibacteriota bacterium]